METAQKSIKEHGKEPRRFNQIVCNAIQHLRKLILKIRDESWHYRYVGMVASKDVYEEGITLEEFNRKEDQIKGWLESDDGRDEYPG